MKQPEVSLEQLQSSHVFKLKKALYGLKHMPGQSYVKINFYFYKGLNFKSFLQYLCIHFRRTDWESTVIALYISALLIPSISEQYFLGFITEICKLFKPKNYG